jgi:hypothetical protein
LLDDYGLQDIQNLRKSGKHFKGVSGHTAINTSAPTTGGSAFVYLANGFHYRKSQPSESHVIVYSANSAAITSGHLFQNTTAIPNAGNFSATVLHTPSYFNHIWRFSNAPGGDMLASNGDETLIWSGSETEATSFVTTTVALSGVTTTLTNPNDYTDQVRNTQTDAENVAYIGGGNDSYTKLLLHVDGADGSTTFTDSSGSAHTVLSAGSAQIDVDQKKYGTASLLLTSATSTTYAITADHADWNMGTGAFTVDFWVRFNAVPGADQAFFSQYVDGTNYVRCFYNKSTGLIDFTINDGGTSQSSRTLFSPAANTWYHVAIVRGWAGSNTTIAVAIDGTDAGAQTGFTNEWKDLAASFEIGAFATANNLEGWIDEFRVTKGAARWTADFTPPSRPYTSASNTWLIGFKRPLQGVKYYVSDVNTSASTLTAYEWNGASWSGLTVTDNTVTGGKSLGQTGTVTWSSTVNTSKPRYINGLSLYWYEFTLSAGEATIYYTTVDAPIQSIKNIWDGAEQQAVKVLKYDSVYKDYTAEAGDGALASYVDMSAASTAVDLYLGFVDPQQAFNFTFVAGYENTNASTLTVSYWDGSAWAAVSTQSDGTSASSKSFSKTGVVAFQAPEKGTEYKRAFSDEYPLYYYKLEFSAALSSSVRVGEIRGIPSPPTLPPYRFSESFQSRAFLFNEKNGAKNKAIYSVTDATDIFNGSDSGVIYFGDKTPITAAAVVYNVFQTTAVEQLLVTKENETWRLSGADPENWTLQKMSGNIGCVAPLSMVSAEATNTSTEVKRAVAIWVSDKGPVMSDGANIIPIGEDIRCYWDPNDSRFIPVAWQPKSVGWYDTQSKSYKLLIASGATSSALNTELEYSLPNREWTKIYRENAAGANPLQSGWPVWDTNGLGYTYGGGKDGFMYRLENGNNWNSVANITSYIHTKDMILDNQTPLFRTSIIKYLRTAYKLKSVGNITVNHYGDRVLTISGTSNQAGPALITSASTTYYNTQSTQIGPFLYHSLKYTATTNVADGLELTGMGVYFEPQTVIR